MCEKQYQHDIEQIESLGIKIATKKEVLNNFDSTQNELIKKYLNEINKKLADYQRWKTLTAYAPHWLSFENIKLIAKILLKNWWNADPKEFYDQRDWDSKYITIS